MPSRRCILVVNSEISSVNMNKQMNKNVMRMVNSNSYWYSSDDDGAVEISLMVGSCMCMEGSCRFIVAWWKCVWGQCEHKLDNWRRQLGVRTSTVGRYGLGRFQNYRNNITIPKLP